MNRIAAGEVVERPASAVKELVENALDAGARRIEVSIADGGRSLIRVADDGCGMAPDDLPLALSRHATSKIDGTDLLNIRSFGFRGEALPSMAAVGRLSLTSRVAGEAGASLTVQGGQASGVRPAALTRGTVVELRDLFYATPARLKFLKTDRAEAMAVADVMRRLAMAQPAVTFHLTDLTGGEERAILRLSAETGDPAEALQRRLSSVLGRDFAANAVEIDAWRDGFHLTGFAALPTFSRGSALTQHLFVNGRPVKDRLLTGALRAAYMDVMSRDRHPAAALYLTCDPVLVDVNVHPAKTEVRFRDAALVRGLVVSALRHALAATGHRGDTTLTRDTLAAFRPQTAPALVSTAPMALRQTGFAEVAAPSVRAHAVPEEVPVETPLGSARAQVHGTYIIAQTATGLVIVDQHAAHERLVYEKLKAQVAARGVAAQRLLIPEIVTLGAEAELVLAQANELARLGLEIEGFGPGSIAVRATPALLGTVDCAALLRDLADELADQGDTALLGARLDAILSRIACHGSVRSGRAMLPAEMDALLREMEATPHSGQCNHGRPTWVELQLSDIEKLFGRR